MPTVSRTAKGGRAMSTYLRRFKRGWTAGLVVAASCFSWGAPTYSGGSLAFGTDATGQRTAIATWQVVDQRGSGGIHVDGSERILSSGVLVWECDANARQLHAFGLLPYTVNNFGGDSIVVTAWQPDNFVVYAPIGATTEMRVLLSGTYATVPAVDTIAASQVISPYCATVLDSLRSLPRSGLK
jgi:hypothetical protein